MEAENNKNGVSALLGSKHHLSLLAFIAIIVAITGGALAYSSASCAGNQFDRNDQSEYQGTDKTPEDTGRRREKNCNFKINWSPAHAAVTLGPGETKTVQVTTTISGSHPELTADVAPALKPYLSVSPTSIPASKKNQTVTFNLTASIPADALPTTLDGTIHLRYGKATSSKPLPIFIDVENIGELFINSESVAFAKPAQWIIQYESDGSQANLYSPDDIQDLNDSGGSFAAPTITVSVLPNSDDTALSEFAALYDESWYTSYAHQEIITIAGRSAIIYDDSSATLRHSPNFAAFILLPSSVALVTGQGTRLDFDNFLSTITFQ